MHCITQLNRFLFKNAVINFWLLSLTFSTDKVSMSNYNNKYFFEFRVFIMGSQNLKNGMNTFFTICKFERYGCNFSQLQKKIKKLKSNFKKSNLIVIF